MNCIREEQLRQEPPAASLGEAVSDELKRKRRNKLFVLVNVNADPVNLLGKMGLAPRIGSVWTIPLAPPKLCNSGERLAVLADRRIDVNEIASVGCPNTS